ncbi:hypothetical protein ACS0TY_013922 [Phlomoides rotata]
MAATAARPLVSVQSLENASNSVHLPDVMNAISAESWGTGRAVSRIPRVLGGSTHRTGQGAFGNMCLSGHMFAPTKIWHRWHRRVNVTQKQHAVISVIAASVVPSLVLARGHKIEEVPKLPLVVSYSAEAVENTNAAIKILNGMLSGPLVVYGSKGAKLTKAFRNIPGVEVAHVSRLNLLKLAPGGHLGRFIIWTKSAFEKLDEIYGTPACGLPMSEKKTLKLILDKLQRKDIYGV